MKKCMIPLSSQAITIATILLLAAASILPFRAITDESQSPFACAAIGVCLLTLALCLLWRTISRWGWGILYDDQGITFVLSRKDRRTYRWEELPGARVAFGYPPNPTFFFFPDGKTLPLTPRMTGREELIATLRRRDFPAASSFPADTFRDISRVLQSTPGQPSGRDDRRG